LEVLQLILDAALAIFLRFHQNIHMLICYRYR